MLKILHVAPHLRAGGTMQMAADLACALRQRGDSHNIVLSPANELVSKLLTAGVEHRLCRIPNLLNGLAELHRLRGLVRSLRPHIIQVYGTVAAIFASAACSGLKEEKPRIVGVLTAYPRTGCSLFRKSCDAVVTISKHLRQESLKSCFKHHRKDLQLIPYGVNEKQCFPAFPFTADKKEQWRTSQPEARNRLTLCIPGAISSLHGLEDLIPILSTLLHQGIPTHAFIAGDSRKADPLYTEQLKNKFAAANLTDHISWIGARPDLREVLCACDITLSLTRRPATYDRPVLEALALGRPVLGYDHGVVGELLEAFLPEGRVAPGDAAAMADTIIQWHTYRPSTLTELPAPYRISDTAESFMQLYRSLLGHTESGHS